MKRCFCLTLLSIAGLIAGQFYCGLIQMVLTVGSFFIFWLGLVAFWKALCGGRDEG